LQDLDVTFALDRAGLVGADGATHAGNYDIAYLRCIPNMVIAAPSDENETRLLLTTCYQHVGPSAVRYPRGAGVGAAIDPALASVPVGQAVVRRKGKRVAILAFGTLLHPALVAGEALDATVVDMRFVKPLDEALLQQLASTHDGFVTVEEGSIMAGAGSAVAEYLNAAGVLKPVLQLGLPDRYIDHGDQARLLVDLGLDASGIEQSVRNRFPA